MKKLLFIVLIGLSAVSAQAADVGVSISIGDPGFFGRIDIGSAPKPEVVSPRPIVVQPGPAYGKQEPLYLRVPPGHQKNWNRHCGQYNACDRPVYFVRDSWYDKVYVPHYQRHREEYRKGGAGPKDAHGRGDRNLREDRGPKADRDARDERNVRDDRDRGSREERGGHGQGLDQRQ